MGNRCIDAEILELNREARNRAESILKANKSFLDKLADALLEKETLEAEEVVELLKGAKLPEDAKLHA